MKKLVTGMSMVVALSAVTGATYAAGPIRSTVQPTLCMAVKGTVSEGANVQLQQCSSPPGSDVHLVWFSVGNKVCQLGPDFIYYCIDYDGAPPNPGDNKDAKVTKWAGWKANQDWSYSNSNKKFDGHSNMCLDVNKLEVGGAGQIKVSACEAWKTYQMWESTP